MWQDAVRPNVAGVDVIHHFLYLKGTWWIGFSTSEIDNVVGT
jgi:hypothetical protein